MAWNGTKRNEVFCWKIVSFLYSLSENILPLFTHSIHELVVLAPLVQLYTATLKKQHHMKLVAALKLTLMQLL